MQGSILFIHGSAPFNRDGRVPDERAGKYAKMSFYKDLAEEFEDAGWKVFRYNKLGVTADIVDFNQYNKTDLKQITNQVMKEWNKMPVEGPRLVFAWSEGSLHVGFLPLEEVDGVVILGGISTNIRDVILWQVGDQREKVIEQLEQLEKKSRTEMFGLDRPVGRLIDEIKLEDNWTLFKSKKSTPLLILHGDSDREVPLDQAEVWREKLLKHDLSIIIGKGRNHTFGFGDFHGASEIAAQTLSWWKKRRPERN